MSGQPDVYTEARIQRTLAEDPRVAALGLQATVRPPKVFLRGEVPSEERRERAAEVVHDLLPDFEIYNEIEVTGAQEPYSREELR
jgi:osmotically-inducible protein OsmY